MLIETLSFRQYMSRDHVKSKTSPEPRDKLQMKYKSIMRTGELMSEYRYISFHFI